MPNILARGTKVCSDRPLEALKGPRGAGGKKNKKKGVIEAPGQEANVRPWTAGLERLELKEALSEAEGEPMAARVLEEAGGKLEGLRVPSHEAVSLEDFED